MPCSSVRMFWTPWLPGIVLNVIYRSELMRSMTLKIGKIFGRSMILKIGKISGRSMTLKIGKISEEVNDIENRQDI